MVWISYSLVAVQVGLYALDAPSTGNSLAVWALAQEKMRLKHKTAQIIMS